MPRTDQPIESVEEKDGRRDTHPAFAVATVTRGHGSPRTIFQSDLRHNETITLSIRTADRTRYLMRDWVFPRTPLVEVEMSLAQWGSLVSSIGIGSGVSVTLRATKDDYMIPGIPYEPRIAESVAETKGAVSRLLARAKETLEALETAIDQKQGVKAVREAMRLHASTLQNAESNAAFAVKSLTEAAESVTSQARADIEAQILNAAQITGTTASIEAPEDMKAVTS